MATFEELSAEQQESYLNFMLLVRPTLGRIENSALLISNMVTLWTAEIQAIHSLLDANAVIPDNTGYPNSTTVIKSEVSAGLQLLQDVLALRTATTTELAVKCVGPENILNTGLLE